MYAIRSYYAPSHNPPEDGGFKYNPPEGGPADTTITKWIENRAAELLEAGSDSIRRLPYAKALKSPLTTHGDLVMPYVRDLSNVIDMDAVKGAGLKVGVDPLGGASVVHWQAIAEHYGLNIEVVNTTVDPTFGFMRVDKDGKIRMDCSSPYAMAGLLEHRERFDLSCGNDPDRITSYNVCYTKLLRFFPAVGRSCMPVGRRGSVRQLDFDYTQICFIRLNLFRNNFV